MTIGVLPSPADLRALLLGASFRGVPYQTLDTSTDVGRRTVAFLFPGQDARQFQDLGALDGPVRVSGLVVGDDYVAQAAALAAAFRTPGPGTLIDPWLGTLEVVLQGLPTISYKDGELRIARFSATFLPYRPLEPSPPDTLTALLGAAEAAVASAGNYLGSLLSPAIIPLAIYSYGESVVARVATLWGAVTSGGAGVAQIAPAAAPAIAALAILPETPAVAWGPLAVAGLMGVPAAVAAASVPTPPAAVAPGGSIATPVPADPAQTTNLLLAAAPQFSTFAGDPSPGPGVACCLAAAAAIAAVQAASDIVYPSQQAAEAMQARLLAAIDAAVQAALAQAQTAPSEAGGVWRAMMALRAAMVADMSAVIGRLPPVVEVTLARALPAWLIANTIAGDLPSAIFPAYQDIIARNRVADPGVVPGPVVEVLA